MINQSIQKDSSENKWLLISVMHAPAVTSFEEDNMSNQFIKEDK
jgi:hypothetical protein